MYEVIEIFLRESKVMNSATLSVEPACHSYLGNDQQDVFTHL